jgi:dephospho-CoA kinase
MAIWAVTGGIACGKSAVINAFKALGATCYSADADARDVLTEPDVDQQVRAAFPDAIDDHGQLDRAKLGGLIFADSDRRARLGQIMHPYIRARMKARIEQNHASSHSIPELYEVPLLFEGGLETWFHGTICVTCKPEIQRQRLVDRHFSRYQSMLSDEEVKQVLSSQLPVTEKADRSDIVIDNSGTEAELIQAVTKVFATLSNRTTP